VLGLSLGPLVMAGVLLQPGEGTVNHRLKGVDGVGPLKGADGLEGAFFRGQGPARIHRFFFRSRPKIKS
jgi:hypothetical protein